MSRITNKTTLAIEQLEDAIQLFVKDRCVSALTLAGAAEGVLSGLLKSRGLETSAESSVKTAHQIREIVSTGQVSDTFLYSGIYKGRNRAKHHDPGDSEKILFDRSGEALMMLLYAMSNADRLGIRYRNKKMYRQWFKENFGKRSPNEAKRNSE
jgi:hypothetical protein